ncbi:MAG: PAS domain S-box protein [Rhodospirillaceae bacterium]|nr:PAS domain S-box protein [Rhodospirillales bacterium]
MRERDGGMAGWGIFKRIKAFLCGCGCEGQQRLAQLLLEAPAVVYAATWDANMTVTFISPNVRDMTGHAPEDFLRIPNFWRTHLHPDDFAHMESARPALLERGHASWKYRFRHADGGYRWTRDEIKLIRGEDGQPKEVVGAWLDITEHRQSEEALAASEEQLRATERLLADALESSDDAFSLFDAEDRLLRFNSRYRDLYPTISDMIRPGVTFTELLRASALRGQYYGVSPDQAEEWVRDRMTCHAAATGTFEQRLSDGRCLEIVERRTADGGRVAIRRDVSPRKRIEEALRRELAFEQTLIDALPLPVFFKGCDGRYLGCNTKFSEALGLPIDKIVGRTLYEVMPPEKAEEYARADQEILDNPAAVQSYETTMKWGDGSIRRLNVFKGVFRGTDGAIAGFIGSLIDLTQQKRAEEQLVQAAKLATLGQIASEVAHELNQPLSIIRMSAESCLQGHGDSTMAPDKLQRKLSTICGQVARMAEIVNHLRSFSRTETGPKRSFALAPVVQSAARLLSPHYQLDAIALVTDLEASCPDVSGHPNQIEQVVLNLLANARDAVRTHCPSGQGRVELRLTAENGWAQLMVTDNGGGIPEHLWPTVFDPFFTTKADGAGTGLGLSISANIVAGMAGHIQGRNVGGGACFTVSLPLHRATGNSEDHAGTHLPHAICAPAPVQGGPRGRILVVDDEALAVECIAEFLQGRGFEVVTATGPGPALDLAREHRLDMIITDMRMPGMEGAALLERLRNRAPHLPAVLMTGGPVPVEPPMAGAVILRKPLALDQLANEVDRLLAARKETSCPA